MSRGSASIRIADANDAAAIARVHVQAWQEAYAGQLPASFLDSIFLQTREESWNKQLSEGARVWVSESGGQIAGFASCGSCRDSDGDGLGEIYAIYVLREFWG